MKQSKTEIFIAKARAKHGDRYDYSLVEYVRSTDKVKIICKEHGAFDQVAITHYGRGSDCPKCTMLRLGSRLSYCTDTFIEKANAVHHGRYDYSLVDYKKSGENIKIICTDHGVFETRPNRHLRGHNCPKCGSIATGDSRRSSAPEFVEKAKEIHGDLYDYSLVVYKQSKKPVKIICKEHGVFEQKPNGHLSGQGCGKCGGTQALDTATFIERATAMHKGRYDYSKSSYVLSDHKVTIICKDHGEFEQNAKNHMDGSGCSMCLEYRTLPTHIYLLDGCGKVKIGISMQPEKRLMQLKAVQPIAFDPVKSWVLADFNKAFEVEQYLHAKLATFNSGYKHFEGATEWFDVSVDRAKREIASAIMLLSDNYDQGKEDSQWQERSQWGDQEQLQMIFH